MANEFSKSRASAGALSFAQAENLADIKTFSLRTSQQKQVEQNRKLIDEYYQEQNKPKVTADLSRVFTGHRGYMGFYRWRFS